MFFAWDESNIDHIAGHRVTPAEAEFVVDRADAPWPQEKGHGKFVVWGAAESGRLLQVIFVLKRPDELEFESLTIEEWDDLDEDDQVIYVIHAMDLTPTMKRLYRKKRRPQ